ncbi:hypothetical protein D3C76_1583210 [compost metagenome]
MAGDRAVEATPDYLAVLHQHRAHRHLAQQGALLGQGQGFTHEVFVAAAVDDLGLAHGRAQATSMAAIRPVSIWSMTWQWNIHTPGLSATSAMRAVSFLPSR